MLNSSYSLTFTRYKGTKKKRNTQGKRQLFSPSLNVFSSYLNILRPTGLQATNGRSARGQKKKNGDGSPGRTHTGEPTQTHTPTGEPPQADGKRTPLRRSKREGELMASTTTDIDNQNFTYRQSNNLI